MFDRCSLFELKLAETRAHGGQGLILFTRIVSEESINGACNFIDFTKMPPGTSIGEHSHARDQEEYYLIIKGVGLMNRDGQDFQVQAGDLIRNFPGGTHALKNIGEGELWIFVFELKVLAR